MAYYPDGAVKLESFILTQIVDGCDLWVVRFKLLPSNTNGSYYIFIGSLTKGIARLIKLYCRCENTTAMENCTTIGYSASDRVRLLRSS